jgi:hypothetical protein
MLPYLTDLQQLASTMRAAYQPEIGRQSGQMNQAVAYKHFVMWKHLFA